MAVVPRDLVREIIRLMGQDPHCVRSVSLVMTPQKIVASMEVMKRDKAGHPLMNRAKDDLSVKIVKYTASIEGE